MATPIGTIYSTNITPDRQFGIGDYSEADFASAVREGVASDGHRLYPAMPFPSYVKTSDEDIHALYTYFIKSVAPISQPNRAADIGWPMNMRWPLIAWSFLFLDKTRFEADSQQNAEWNRGAYLVQSLGHCGACHTPRGIGFQEKALDHTEDAYLSGARVENWFASNLTGDHNTGLGRWSTDDIKQFLQTGANQHASAFGSMTDVINNSTQWLSDYDAHAIATYLKSLPGSRDDDGRPYEQPYVAVAGTISENRGRLLYDTHCVQCHGANGRGRAPWLAPLSGNPNVLEPDTTSVINVTLNGANYIVLRGIPAPFPMPEFHAALKDQDVADVANYIRRFSREDAEKVSAAQVKAIRDATRKER